VSPLWKPSAKPEHDASLKRFIYKFNQAPPKDISMSMWAEEKFVHDGTINLLGVIVPYDWEKRQDWHGEKFPYLTLGQLERKFDPEKGIELTIQCNVEESYFVTAWHKDFSSEIIEVSRETDYEQKEKGKMRVTRKFKIFSYNDIAGFKRWLLKTKNKPPKIKNEILKKVKEGFMFTEYQFIKADNVELKGEYAILKNVVELGLNNGKITYVSTQPQLGLRIKDLCFHPTQIENLPHNPS